MFVFLYIGYSLYMETNIKAKIVSVSDRLVPESGSSRLEIMKIKVENEIAEYIERTNEPAHHYLNNFKGYFPGGMYHEMPEELLKKYRINDSKETMFVFIEKIYDAIEHLGLDADFIETLNRNGANEPEKLFEAILPLYIYLRSEGYEHYPDLTR